MKKIFVGIDVSKMWIDVCVTLDGKIITHQQFENNKMGFKAMVRWGSCSLANCGKNDYYAWSIQVFMHCHYGIFLQNKRLHIA